MRELENKLNSAIIMADGSQITALDLQLEGLDEQVESLNLRQVRHEAERQALVKVLARTGGNLSRAADILGITRPTIYDLIKKHELSAEEQA